MTHILQKAFFKHALVKIWRKVKMSYSFVFFLNSALLGVGLAMDAFSVSLANGLHEPKMRVPEKCAVLPGFSADSRPLCPWPAGYVSIPLWNPSGLLRNLFRGLH